MDLWPKEKFSARHVRAITAIVARRFRVVKKTRHAFSPFGETIVYILASSHFTLHTYPEHNFISLDVYACTQSSELKALVREIRQAVPPKRFRTRIISRRVRS